MDSYDKYLQSNKAMDDFYGFKPTESLDPCIEKEYQTLYCEVFEALQTINTESCLPLEELSSLYDTAETFLLSYPEHCTEEFRKLINDLSRHEGIEK